MAWAMERAPERGENIFPVGTVDIGHMSVRISSFTLFLMFSIKSGDWVISTWGNLNMGPHIKLDIHSN